MKWIKVEEHLPDIDTICLCWNDRLCEIEICRFDGTGGHGPIWEAVYDYSTSGSEMITHWMQMPERPD